MRRALRLDAAESFPAVRKCDVVVGLLGQAHGCPDRAVASTDHENLLIDVVIGLNQPIHHFRQFLAVARR